MSYKARLLALCVGVTLALYFIPYGYLLAYPLLLISTVAHELGHGLTAILLGGHFSTLEMWQNGAGQASFSLAPSRLARALAAAGGLIGPAVVAALAFVCARQEKASRWCLTGLGLILVVTFLTVVKGLFAYFFIGLLAAALLTLGLKVPARWSQPALVFLAVQLSLSVFSRADYLFTDRAGDKLSDVAAMAEALWLPYWLWGALCGLFSIAVLAGGCWLYLKDER